MEGDCEFAGVEFSLVCFLSRCIHWLCWVAKIGCYIWKRSDDTVNKRFLAWMLCKTPANAMSTHGVYTKYIVIDETPSVWIHLFVPINEEGGFPIVVYFHGGDFSMLSSSDESYKILCRRLAK
jgi:acetyl esterase/lipase